MIQKFDEDWGMAVLEDSMDKIDIYIACEFGVTSERENDILMAGFAAGMKETLWKLYGKDCFKDGRKEVTDGTSNFR